MTIQYKKVATGFYQDAKVASFGIQPPHPTTFLQWILTGPVLGMVPGCASIGRYGMAEQSGWTPDQIEQMLLPLTDSGIIQFESNAPFLYMPMALKYNAPRSPSNVMSWQSDWRRLPNCVLKERAWHGLRIHCEHRDSETRFSAKKPRDTRNSFLEAFSRLDKPPPTPINSDLTLGPTIGHPQLNDTNRNRNRNRNKGDAENTPENVTSIDASPRRQS